MRKKAFLFTCFGCIGITTEVVFTAVSDVYAIYIDTGKLNLRLTGYSYIWMFFIYGIAPLLFERVYRVVKNIKLIYRLVIYTAIIFSVEFVSGFILDKLLGSCPWEYKGKYAVCGYIRLDYTFFWMVFGYMIEKIFLFLDGLYPIKKISSSRTY